MASQQCPGCSRAFFSSMVHAGVRCCATRLRLKTPRGVCRAPHLRAPARAGSSAHPVPHAASGGSFLSSTKQLEGATPKSYRVTRREAGDMLGTVSSSEATARPVTARDATAPARSLAQQRAGREPPGSAPAASVEREPRLRCEPGEGARPRGPAADCRAAQGPGPRPRAILERWGREQ